MQEAAQQPILIKRVASLSEKPSFGLANCIESLREASLVTSQGKLHDYSPADVLA
jgi:hypothetical protein